MTPVHGKGPRARLARRAFLGALAVVPAALACATSGSSSRTPAAPAKAASEGTPVSREKLALDAVRSFALTPEAGPAIVFRAAPARPGGPR